MDVSVDVLKSSRLFIKRFFRTLVEAVWNRVLEEDVQERIWDKVDQWKMEKEEEEERKKQGEEEKKEMVICRKLHCFWNIMLRFENQ